MRVDDLVLFAINTGEFYKTHCDFARTHASLETWRQHVGKTVFPLYKREYNRAAQVDGDPLIYSLSNNYREQAAIQLWTYYRNHVREGQSDGLRAQD